MMPSFLLRRARFALALVAGSLVAGGLLAGCGAGGAPTAPPAGWQAAQEPTPRWWREGVDTSAVFRPLETLADMGVADSQAVLTVGGTGLTPPLLVYNVKRRMRAFFRHDPATIDSLFGVHARDKLLAMNTNVSDVEDFVDTQRDRTVRTLRARYREPRRLTSLGEDVQVTYPDSLRAAGVAGRVKMQLRLDDEGVPQAVQVIESVHPTLDALALRAATQMRWQPAYVKRGNAWNAEPAFVRWSVRFRQQ